ncbi:conserved hypothetical protein [Theileria orientalis strain Shintoku]|uniref:Uncharacterized protein n=1 Tax=Theileria orientalis strain Shintoku TaxID=869250 RepID=J4D9Q3_THEOR|nr:conserved hypothetical protein [Theileria orientalis strain Shintoku]BAM41530.1 conserved hypothetical protein [Theileria orientalis strain Shintoku]|eukprot:XP_009691831.1 conserved hypothetical protein [Theileria orientalis strain Shintoku]
MSPFCDSGNFRHLFVFKSEHQRSIATVSEKIRQWDYEVSIVDSYKKGESHCYKFLKNDWGYLDHYNDPNQPAGVIEGGPQNYEGKGLALKGGKDRMRTEYLPYYLDHGVRFRKRVSPGSISYDITPIASQDFEHCESDFDFERKQWGSWHQPQVAKTCYLRGAFRSFVEIDNPTELPYRWITRFEVIEPLPLHRRPPTTLIPSPHPDLRFAALNCLGGFLQDHADALTNEQALIRQKKLLKEWNRLERRYRKTRDQKLLEEIKNIKFALFGISETSDEDSEMLRLIIDVGLIRARRILQEQAKNWRTDPETIEHYITRFRNGPLDPTSDYMGPEKTVALNLVNYRPMSKKFRKFTTIEEMAELYHTLVTEERREGRSHTKTHMATHNEYKQYALRKHRKNFPALEAEYKPIWANRSYGSEFGDAIRKSQKIPEHDLGEFGKPLKRKRRQLTRDERKRNFRDDYGSFNSEYNY